MQATALASQCGQQYADEGRTVKQGVSLGYICPTSLDVWVESTAIDQTQTPSNTRRHHKQGGLFRAQHL